MELRRKRKVIEVQEESTSGSASSGDRLRGEARSKRREDPALRSTAARVEGGRGNKGVEFDDTVGEYVVRHRCALEAICGLVEELSDAQLDAVRGTVWYTLSDFVASHFPAECVPRKIRSILARCTLLDYVVYLVRFCSFTFPLLPPIVTENVSVYVLQFKSVLCTVLVIWCYCN